MTGGVSVPCCPPRAPRHEATREPRCGVEHDGCQEGAASSKSAFNVPIVTELPSIYLVLQKFHLRPHSSSSSVIMPGMHVASLCRPLHSQEFPQTSLHAETLPILNNCTIDQLNLATSLVGVRCSISLRVVSSRYNTMNTSDFQETCYTHTHVILVGVRGPHK